MTTLTLETYTCKFKRELLIHLIWCFTSQVQDAGRLKIIKRTEGVSTTDIVGRLLLMTRGPAPGLGGFQHAILACSRYMHDCRWPLWCVSSSLPSSHMGLYRAPFTKCKRPI